MVKEKYNTLLPLLQEFFSVNPDLKGDLNRIALKEHNISLDNMIVKWCEKNSRLNDKDFSELVDYLKDLNTAPHSITEMDVMYDFVYDFEE